MPATVQDLVAIRPRIVEEVLAYLDKVAERAAEVPAYYPTHLRSIERGLSAFGEIHQTVRVAIDRREFDRWRVEEAERLRRSGIPLEHTAYSQRPERGQRDDDDREKREAPVRDVIWNESTADSPEFRRSIILGDPGFGKSWLLRHESWRLARKAAEQLRNRTLPLDEIVIPVRLRLSEFQNEPGLIGKAVLNLVCSPAEAPREEARQTTQFRELLRSKLGGTKSVLLLDGWDEVTKDQKELLNRLVDFSQSESYRNQRILLASRIVGYSVSPVDGPLRARIETTMVYVEVTPLEVYQQYAKAVTQHIRPVPGRAS